MQRDNKKYGGRKPKVRERKDDGEKLTVQVLLRAEIKCMRGKSEGRKWIDYWGLSHRHNKELMRKIKG